MFNFFKRFIREHQEDVSTRDKYEAGCFWDPAGGWVHKKDFEAAQVKVDEQFKKYEDNPNIPRRNFYLLCIPVMLFAIITGSQYDILLEQFNSNPESLEGLPMIVFFCGTIPYGYKRFIKGLQRDYIKKLIADKYKWLYNPSESEGHWEALQEKFPQIFNKGNRDQTVYDEFWGQLRHKYKDIPFYSSVFRYAVVSGSGKNRRRKVYHQTIFGFKLERAVKADFMLYPEGAGKAFRWFGSKEIDTESDEFNRTFAFDYEGKKDEKALQIIKTLSPAVQTKLLDLKKSEKYFSILFHQDTVIFSTNGVLIPKMYTNFLKKVSIDQRDEEALRNRMHGILELVGEITPYLN